MRRLPVTATHVYNVGVGFITLGIYLNGGGLGGALIFYGASLIGFAIVKGLNA
jgi:hypothetical protein